MGGQVECADLRVRSDLADGFVGFLLGDVGEERGEWVRRTAAERRGIGFYGPLAGD